jgi:hypothetical protein
MAYLQINDVDDGTSIMFTSPMSSAALKGCHDVQNLGAVQTYLRRYLWTNAFELSEHDALDATTGSIEPAKKVSMAVAPPTAPITVNVLPNESKVTVTKPPIVGKKGEWQIVAPAKPDGDVADWLELIKTSSNMLLDLCVNDEDVMDIFKKNKVLFDTVKATDAAFFKDMMVKFTLTKNQFNKE